MDAPCTLSAHLVQVVRVDDDVQARQLRQAELMRVHARKHDLLPAARAVGLARSVHSSLHTRTCMLNCTRARKIVRTQARTLILEKLSAPNQHARNSP